MRDEVAEEFRGHLDQLVDELIAEGWESHAARVEAERRFGEARGRLAMCQHIAEQIERNERRSNMLGGIGMDVRVVARQARRDRGLTAATVGILGLGIGACAAVFAVADALLVRSLPLPEAHRLVQLWDDQGAGSSGRIPASPPEFEDWRRADVLAAAMAIFHTNLNVEIEGETERLLFGATLGDLPAVLGTPPRLGRHLRDEELAAGERLVAVISSTFWQQRWGGDPGVLGQRLGAYEIVGVLPPEAHLLSARDDVVAWIPAPGWLRGLDRGTHLLTVMARLAPDVRLDRAEASLGALGESLVMEGVTDHRIVVAPYQERLIGDARRPLALLAGAVAVLMTIVLFNLATLTLARSSARVREFAIRSSLGASRGRLARLVLTETCLLGIAGGVLGLLFGRWGLGVVGHVSRSNALLLQTATIDARSTLLMLVVALCVGLSFGVAAALRASRSDLKGMVGDGASGPPARRARSRRMLISAQIAFSVLLLVAAGLFGKSLLALLSVDRGFDERNLVHFRIELPPGAYTTTEEQIAYLRSLRAGLEQIPGILGVAFGTDVPFGGGGVDGGFHIPGKDEEIRHAELRVVSPGFFATMATRLSGGRAFEWSDTPEDRLVAVVSERLARQVWPGDDPIGKSVVPHWARDGESHEVIGVVGDVKHYRLDEERDGTLYLSLSQTPSRGIHIVARTAVEPNSVVPDLRRTTREIDPTQAVGSFSIMQDRVAATLRRERALTGTIVFFAAVAVLLAAVGVYGVVSREIQARTAEMGVRKALGARLGDVVAMVLREEVPSLLVGLAVGILAGLASARVLTSSLFGTSPVDPIVFAAVTVLVLVIGVGATAIPARRAAALDVITALRAE